MTDELHTHEDSHHKVVNIFERHLRGDHYHFIVEEGGEMVISPDGFSYVTFRQEREDNGQAAAKEEELLDLANRKHYIVKFLESHKDAIRVNNYHVPGHRLEEFLMNLSKRPGSLLEIKQFLPKTIG